MLVSRLTFFAASTLLFASVLAAEDAKSSTEPVSSSVDEAIEKGIDFLVADQNKNGSWGSPRQTKGLNIYAPAPGSHEAFVTAVTAMAVSALIESGLCEEDGPPKEALQRGEGYLLENLPGFVEPLLPRFTMSGLMLTAFVRWPTCIPELMEKPGKRLLQS